MLDYQSIYRKDHKENLKIFSDLKNFKELSSYSNDLNRAFGENSYNKFHRHLTEPKQLFSNNSFNVFQRQDNSKNKASSKLFEESFNIKLFKKSLANMKLKDKILNERIKFPFIERMKNSENYLLKKEMQEKIIKQNKSFKLFFPDVPDVGKYYPKYNSINKHSYRAFFGNMPTNRFYTIEHEITKNEKTKDNDENSFSRKIIAKNNLFNKGNRNIIKNHFSLKKIIDNRENKDNENIINNIENNISIRENKSEKTFNIKNSNNISLVSDNNSINNSFNNNSLIFEKSKQSKNNSSFDIDKNASFNKSIISKLTRDNNHSLRFEDYISRKPLNKAIIYNTDIKDELPNYYTSKYIKNNINFDRNKNLPNYIEQAINRDKNPPLGFYEPKYNYIFNNIDKNIYFYKKNLTHIAKNNLKKIFCEYNVTTDYQTVPSLNYQNEEKKIDNNEEK